MQPRVAETRPSISEDVRLEGSSALPVQLDCRSPETGLARPKGLAAPGPAGVLFQDRQGPAPEPKRMLGEAGCGDRGQTPSDRISVRDIQTVSAVVVLAKTPSTQHPNAPEHPHMHAHASPRRDCRPRHDCRSQEPADGEGWSVLSCHQGQPAGGSATATPMTQRGRVPGAVCPHGLAGSAEMKLKIEATSRSSTQPSRTIVEVAALCSAKCLGSASARQISANLAIQI